MEIKMRLDEFEKPDYSKLSEEELVALMNNSLDKIENIIERKTQNDDRRSNTSKLQTTN